MKTTFFIQTVIIIAFSAINYSHAYQFTYIEAVEGTLSTRAYGINDVGDVTGRCGSCGDVSFLYSGSDGSISLFDTSPVIGSLITAHDINNNGTISGDYASFEPNINSGFNKNGSSFNSLTVNVENAEHTLMRGINDAGTTVGWYLEYRINGGAATHSFIMSSSGGVTTMVYPGTGGIRAIGINGSGVVVGQCLGCSSPGFYYNGSYNLLNGPAYGINDAGVIVGDGFIYKEGTYYAFAVPDGSRTYAQDINSSGVIAGYYRSGFGSRGFIATPEAGDPTFVAAEPEPETPAFTTDANANTRAASTHIDPINTFTGELFTQKARELNLGGPMPLYFQRYYSSYLRRSLIVGDLGSNWRHNFDARLYQNGTTITYVSHDGRVTKFINNGGWNQTTNLDTPYSISVSGGQNTTLYDPEVDRIFTFDFTTSSTIIGKLIKVEDGHGNAHSITYNLTNAQIQTISDGLGRTLTFTYNNDAIPKISVVDDGSRSITFQYTDAIDTEYLTLAIDQRGGTTKYAYKDTSANADHALMIYMTRARGNTPYTQTFYGTSDGTSSGKVASQTDADNNTHLLSYNNLNTTLTDPAGNVRIHTHTSTGEFSNRRDETGLDFNMGSDTTGRRNTITDRLNATTNVVYDANSGDVKSINNADGGAFNYSYTSRTASGVTRHIQTAITHADTTTESITLDANGNPVSLTDQASNSSSATFNSYGQTLTETNLAGGITTYSYNADGTMNSVQSPAGDTTIFAYDGLRRLNKTTQPDTTSTRLISLDDGDNILAITDENNNTINMSYDSNNNLVTIQDALANTRTQTYDNNDRLISITDPLNGVTRQAFNSIGQLADSTDANNNKTIYTYNSLGRRTSIKDPNGQDWGIRYDLEGVMTSSTDSLSNTIQFTSDSMGRITHITSPLGHTSEHTFDIMGRVIASINALEKTTNFTYDLRGLLSSVSLPGGIVTALYARNELGNITTLTDPNAQDWLRTFDNMGRSISSTDPLGNTETYAYNNRNHHVITTFPNSLGSQTLGYDPAGNLTSNNYSDGTSFTMTYNANNRLLSSEGLTLNYDANEGVISSNGISIVRDAGGRVTSMTLASGKAVTYVYDANDNVTQVSDWNGGTTTFTYDAANRLTKITRPNNVTTAKTYNEDSQLVGIAEGSLASIILARDGKGQITQATRNLPQVASAINLNNATATVDAASQLNTSSYDAMGRTIAEGNHSYTWNLASQLISLTTASGTTTASYNATGKRLDKTKNGVTKSYVWNHALGLPSVSIEKADGSDTRYYVHTPDGRLLYSMEAADNARRFYHFDEMGNTMFITNDAGNVVQSYAYTPFGKLIASTGSLENSFTWLGEYGISDEGDGLYYMRARYYNSDTGRFLSRDSISSIDPHEINPYQYALANPLLFIDVTGRQSHSSTETDVAVAKADRAVAKKRVEKTKIALEKATTKVIATYKATMQAKVDYFKAKSKLYSAHANLYDWSKNWSIFVKFRPASFKLAYEKAINQRDDAERAFFKLNAENDAAHNILDEAKTQNRLAENDYFSKDDNYSHAKEAAKRGSEREANIRHLELQFKLKTPKAKSKPDECSDKIQSVIPELAGIIAGC